MKPIFSNRVPAPPARSNGITMLKASNNGTGIPQYRSSILPPGPVFGGRPLPPVFCTPPHEPRKEEETPRRQPVIHAMIPEKYYPRPELGKIVPSPSTWGSSSKHGSRAPKPSTLFSWLRPAEGSSDIGALEGFKNTGNTCYLNSVITALLHLPAFVHVLMNDEVARAIESKQQPAPAPTSTVVDLTSDDEGEVVAKPCENPAPLFTSLRSLALKRLESSEVINPAEFKAVSRLSFS